MFGALGVTRKGPATEEEDATVPGRVKPLDVRNESSEKRLRGLRDRPDAVQDGLLFSGSELWQGNWILTPTED
jgi:hypothetical protein